MRRLRHSLLVISLLAMLFAAGLAAPAGASKKSPSPSPALANLSQAVPQSYDAGQGVQTGMIVELDPKNPKSVIPLPSADIQSLLGVVIPHDNSVISISPGSAKQRQVLVATSGHYNVLVSNQNGPVQVGDFVTISSLNGVGMAADENQIEVIGKAAGNFSGSSNVLGTVSLKNEAGQDVKVAVGRIPVDMYISHNPLFNKSADFVPGFLAKVAVGVAKHPVSVARIYLSMAVLLITAFVVANMLYSGIRSGMIAVGRNPLSKKSIIRSLIETVLAGLIVFVVGVFGVYLLLKL